MGCQVSAEGVGRAKAEIRAKIGGNRIQALNGQPHAQEGQGSDDQLPWFGLT